MIYERTVSGIVNIADTGLFVKCVNIGIIRKLDKAFMKQLDSQNLFLNHRYKENRHLV